MGSSSSQVARRGLMLALSSPSGAGKSTIARRLLAGDTGLHLSVSATSRARRSGEVEGVDYRFVDRQDFQLMLNRGEFLEHAKVFDNYYGTPIAAVEQNLASGKDIIFDIDWQGVQQIKAKKRDDLVSVFILPPSVPELERRLNKRGQDSPQIVARRMAEAADGLSHYPEYDYVIVNHNLDDSIACIQAILTAERARRHRLTGLTDFVKNLRSEV